MALLQGIAITLRIVVALIVILLVVACVVLLRGSARRHVFAIVAFAFAGVLSLACLIAVPIVDNIIMEQLVDATAAFVALLIPDLIRATAWPWLTLAVSLIGIIMAVWQLRSKPKAPVQSTSDS